MGRADARSELLRSYEQVADEYVRRIYDELRHKPFDRELLDRFAGVLRGGGPVCDMGCGPGHVARYLSERGVQVLGVDLSPAMLERARRLNPGIDFQQGDMTALGVADAVWAGIAAFYSIVHLAPEEVLSALRELRRALRPGGLLLLAFHVGSGVIHLDEWWGHAVSVDFRFFSADQIAEYLTTAGFEVQDVQLREPYPEVEYPSRRAYILASAPA